MESSAIQAPSNANLFARGAFASAARLQDPPQSSVPPDVRGRTSESAARQSSSSVQNQPSNGQEVLGPQATSDPSGSAGNSEQTTVPAQTGAPEQNNDSGQSRDRAGAGANTLTDEQLAEIVELAARDREVRSHEAQHQAVGGSYAGAASFSYTVGPDGVRYAVGGEVPIDVAKISGDPQATIEKMRTVRAAALAPAEPSPADRAVAALATRQLLEAQAELAQQASDERAEAATEAQDQREARNEQQEEEEVTSAAEDFRAAYGDTISVYQDLISLGRQLDGGTGGALVDQFV